jgi:hypothetical protein
MTKINPNGLGLSAAILSGLGMLVMGILAMSGIYLEAFEMMKAWHIWFDASVGGIALGILEAGVFSYIVGYLLGWLYNKFL